MGSGKTTVGKKLANKLGFQFVDLDDLFESEMQQSISEYFNIYGEVVFREKEQQILKRTFEMSDCVISCGGGTPCFYDNMKLINQNGISVYISMAAISLFYRLKNARNKRPLISNMNDDALFEYITDELSKRELYYNQSVINIKGESIDVEELRKMIDKHIVL